MQSSLHPSMRALPLRAALTPHTRSARGAIRAGQSVAVAVSTEKRAPGVGKTSSVSPVAFFDMDNTIVKSNVVMPYVIYRLNTLTKEEQAKFVPVFLLKVLAYLVLDRIDRSLFNRVFYAEYKDIVAEEKTKIAKLVMDKYLRPNILPGARERIAALRRQGTEVVIVSGSLNFLIAPLAEELGATAYFGASLRERAGLFTGEMSGDPVSDKEKARIIKRYAEAKGIDLKQCEAYGDSIADLPMLLEVGRPYVVSPDKKLAAIAQERSWGVEKWRG